MSKKTSSKKFYIWTVLIFFVLAIIFFLTARLFSFFNSSGSFDGVIFGDDTVRIVFVGDIMLDRAVAISAAKFGKKNMFSGVQAVFSGADAVIGNLEGTMGTRPSIAVPGSSILKFTFDPSFAPILRKAGFTAFSLANNHSLDFGHDAYDETREYIHSADMLTFGSALNNKNISTVIQLKDSAVCMVGYHDLYVADASGVLEEITSIRPQCSRVIVFVHWGSEYTHVPDDRQRLLAHQFIDAGADLIIGAHPHVVQPVEVYSGKAIFYSLGNFMFDQNFSFATMHGLAVDVEWGREQTRFKLIPVAISKGQVTVAEDEARDKVLETAVGMYTPDNIAESIRVMGEFEIK